MTSISTLIRTAVTLDSVQVLLHKPLTNHTARELNIASNRIAMECSRLVKAKAEIALSKSTDLIDSALEIDDELEQLKNSLRRVHRELLHMLGDASKPSPLIHDAITSLRKATEDTYTAANQLQWEIAEHDASHAPRGKPVIATNQEELDAALNAIRRKK